MATVGSETSRVLGLWFCLAVFVARVLGQFVASDHARRDGLFRVRDPRKGTVLRALAAVYAVSMLLRLLVTLACPPHTLLDRGLIPVIAHWSLAVFMYLVGAKPGENAPSQSREKPASIRFVARHP